MGAIVDPSREVSQRACAFKLLAEEVRTAAESMHSKDARMQMLRIAESYEHMAAILESIARQRSEGIALQRSSASAS